MQAVVIIEAHGKIRAWSRILRDIGITAPIVATGGHLCSFPDTLFPVGIRLESGSTLDPTRRPDPERLNRILQTVRDAPKGARILIATDHDIEGDVIALDVIEAILADDRSRVDAIFRLRPSAITVEGIRSALVAATPLRESATRTVNDAIQGRARAVSDRWIGAAFSRLAGLPVGRVRSALLGAVFLLGRAPHLLRGRPETGEITLQARASSGGRPFFARIPLTGQEDPDRVSQLIRLARRYEGGLVPGVVRIPMSLSAAVAPRYGDVRPYNTGDILVHAARHHGVSVSQGMRGLQDAYLQGFSSYPRTESRDVSRESAARVVRLGYSCGLDNLDGDHLVAAPEAAADMAHEGLHPVPSMTSENMDRLRSLLRRPIPSAPPAGRSREDVADIMITLIARRAFEAARPIALQRGHWRRDNTAGVSEEDARLLEDLDWFREDGFAFPWSRDLVTKVRQWPMEAILLEMMIHESLGRPSTYAAHVAVAMGSGDLEAGSFPAPPRPSEQGVTSLKRTPSTIWNPATCRMIEAAIENAGNMLKEDTSWPMQERARHRVMAWFGRLPEEIRDTLMAALVDGRGDRTRGLVLSQPEVPESEGPLVMSTELVDPSPYND